MLIYPKIYFWGTVLYVCIEKIWTWILEWASIALFNFVAKISRRIELAEFHKVEKALFWFKKSFFSL